MDGHAVQLKVLNFGAKNQPRSWYVDAISVTNLGKKKVSPKRSILKGSSSIVLV